MDHPAVTTIKGWTGDGIVALRAPIYEELLAIIVLRTDAGLPVVNADRLAAAIGQCTLQGVVNQITPLQTGEPIAKFEKALDVGDTIASGTPAIASTKQRLPSHLFVCGVPRSGTTSLAQALNFHPHIALGIERYRFRVIGGPKDALSPDLFKRERFFQYDETDGARDVFEKYETDYAELAYKWSTVRVVGDKIPRAYMAFSKILATFPNARFIFIARDVEQVAASWQRRADNPDDVSWPSENDHAAAVHEWNRGMKMVEKFFRSTPEKLHLVHYDNLFGGMLDPWDDIFNWLDLPIPSGFISFRREMAQRRPAGGTALSHNQTDYVRSHVDPSCQWWR